jgi:hypothetical protein
MNEPGPSIWLARPELSDEAAAQVLDFLYELVTGFENAYFDQLHRYYDATDDATGETSTSTQNLPRQQPPNPDEDPF